MRWSLGGPHPTGASQPAAAAPAASAFDGIIPPAPRVGPILREGGPRLLVDGLGPFAGFYLGWRLQGLVAGILVATLVSAAVFAYARRQGRPGLLVRLVFLLVLVRAVAGLASGSATVYFGLAVGVDELMAAGIVTSVMLRRPLIGSVAAETYRFPSEVIASSTFLRVFGRASLVWSGYFAIRGIVRLLALLSGGVDRFLLVAVVSDTPCIVALIIWTVWSTVRGFRTSAEWGDAIAALDEAGPA